MAKAEPGTIYATADVLDRSNTLFETDRARAVRGQGQGRAGPGVVGRHAPRARATRQVSLQRLPLIGRDAELGVDPQGARAARARERAAWSRSSASRASARRACSRRCATPRRASSKLHATCEAYTRRRRTRLARAAARVARIRPGRPRGDVVEARLRDEVATQAPDLAPWLPLLGAAFDVEIAPTPEVEMLAEENRRAKLHETVGAVPRGRCCPTRRCIEIDDAHHMDEASAELLAYLVGELRRAAVALRRRAPPGGTGFDGARGARRSSRIELEAARASRTRCAWPKLATAAASAAAARARGRRAAVGRQPAVPARPAALGDRIRRHRGLPDSAEAAAMARIDALAPEDRALVRRAAVFGLTFHPRMLAWFDDDEDGPPPDAATLGATARPLRRRRRRLPALPPIAAARRGLRGAAVQAAPPAARRGRGAHRGGDGRSRRRSRASCRCTTSSRASIGPAWRYATVAAKRAEGVYAYVEAARALRARAGGRAPARGPRATRSSPPCRRRWAMRGTGRASSARRPTPTRPRASWSPATASREAELLLKLSRVEEKLGKYPRGAALGRAGARGARGPAGPRRPPGRARSTSAWYATVLQAQGRTDEALEWAERAVARGGGRRRPGGARRRVLRDGMGATASSARRAREALMLKVAGGLPALGQPRAAGGHPVEPRRRVLLGRPLGRGDVLLRARPRRVAEDRQHRRRGAGAHEHRRDPDRPRRVGRGRGDAAEDAAAVEGVRVPLLPRRLPLDARTRVAARQQDRRGARALRRGAGRILADVGAEHEVLDVDARVAECHAAQGRGRRRARAGRRDPRRAGSVRRRSSG